MAAVAVTDSNLRREDHEGSTSLTSIGSGPGPGQDAERAYQGANSSTRRINTANSDHGFWVTAGTATDMTAVRDDTAIMKVLLLNKRVINNPGVKIRIGHDQSNYAHYFVADGGGQGNITYPPKGGWLIEAINPTVAAWRDVAVGTLPNWTAVDEFAVTGNISATSNAVNLFMDSIDIGEGLFLVGGDGGDADGVWADIVADDEGTATAGRFGHVQTREGVIFVLGKIDFGRNNSLSAVATVFKDKNQTIVFPGGRVAAGWNKMRFDLTNASSDYTLTDHSFIGRGRSTRKVYFDTIDDVDAGTEVVTIVAHGFSTGDAVTYSNQGGSDTIGLTSGNQYFIRRTGANTFTVHATLNNAHTNTSAINLSDGSTGENHSFLRVPDTRPDLEVVGTTGVAFTSPGSTYNGFRFITLTSKCTFTGVKVLNTHLVDLTTNNGGALTDSVFSGQTTEPGEALVKTNTTDNIEGCSFSLAAGERGHAIEVDATGTNALDGNAFTGYWVSPDNEAGATFDTITGVDAGTETITSTAHGFAAGEEIYYNDNGGSDTIGLTDGNRYYAGNITANTFTVHRSKSQGVGGTNALNLSDGSTGETHTFYSGNAAIVNTSGGLVTINVGGGGSSPSVRNVGAATTVINNDATITFTGLKDNTEVLVQRTSDDSVVAHVENATAGSPDNRTFAWTAAAGLNVYYQINHGGIWQNQRVEGFIVPSADASIGIQQLLDRNFFDEP